MLKIWSVCGNFILNYTYFHTELHEKKNKNQLSHADPLTNTTELYVRDADITFFNWSP